MRRNAWVAVLAANMMWSAPAVAHENAAKSKATGAAARIEGPGASVVPAKTAIKSGKAPKPLSLDDVTRGFKLLKEEAGASCSIACENGNHSIACKIGLSCHCSCPGGYVSCHCQ